MATSQQNAETTDENDAVIVDLEPTMLYDPPGTSPASRAALGIGIQAGTLGSLSGATHDLRRERLAKVAMLFVGIYLVLFLWTLATMNLAWLAWALMIVRLVYALLIGILLFSKLPMTHGQTKALEYMLFGGLTAILAVSQYYVNLELINRDSIIQSVAFQKNGVIQMMAMMLMYATFLPNNPKSAAKFLFTIALAQPVAMILLMERPEAALMLEELRSAQQVGANLIFLLIGAVISIFGVWTLNTLRTELHQAKKLGQYHLREKIGAGGMGEVYLAEHQLLKRPCALKLIKTDTLESPVALARFELEVQSAAGLSHPNTIEIFDYGHSDDGTFYYVMEYLKGMNLGDLVSRYGPLPAGRVIYLFRQVCAGLAEAHAMGLIHRDLKPANIFVAVRGGETDVAKVLDFGLVKVAKDDGSPQLTSDQSVSGTPQFMAPEQASGKRDLDSRLDIYALGTVAYYCLTGRPPFVNESPFELMIAHVRDEVDPPSKYRSDVPADLEQVILRCLAKNPADRYPDVKALGRALAACEAAKTWDADSADQWWAVAAKEVRSLQNESISTGKVPV